MVRAEDQSAGTFANQKRCPVCREAGNLAVARVRNARNRALRRLGEGEGVSLAVAAPADLVGGWLYGVKA